MKRPSERVQQSILVPIMILCFAAAANSMFGLGYFSPWERRLCWIMVLVGLFALKMFWIPLDQMRDRSQQTRRNHEE